MQPYLGSRYPVKVYYFSRISGTRVRCQGLLFLSWALKEGKNVKNEASGTTFEKD